MSRGYDQSVKVVDENVWFKYHVNITGTLRVKVAQDRAHQQGIRKTGRT